MERVIHTKETELLTVDDMVDIVKDWLGGCPAAPGNTDVLEVIVSLGIPPHVLAMMAHSLSNQEWSRYQIGKLICSITSNRRTMAALARHGKVYHGLRLDQARKDLHELHAEAREAVQREVLRRVGNGHL